MPKKTSLVNRILWLTFGMPLPGASSAADLQIEHVTVVSPERSNAMHDVLVRVHDGRIVAISKASGSASPAGGDANTIDGSGLFLAPGLIDSHVHLGQIPVMSPDQEAQHPDIAKAARSNSAQLPAVRFHDTDRSDLDAARHGPVEEPGHVPDTYFCGGAALMDGYSMNYAPKPQRYQWWTYMLIEPDAYAGIVKVILNGRVLDPSELAAGTAHRNVE